MCVNAAEASKLETLKGKVVSAKISQPRNLAFHRKFFALMKATLDMIDQEYNVTQWRTICLCGAGWCDFVPGPDGVLCAVPKSISFADMDQTEFELLYSNVLDYICREYVTEDRETIDTIVGFM